MKIDDNDVVIVETEDDIKQIIKGFSTSDNKLSTTVNVEGNDYSLVADGYDYYNMIKDGLKVIKAGMGLPNESDSVLGKMPSAVNIENHAWLDELIRIRLGGKRVGTRIKWVIGEKTYLWSPLDGKMVVG